MQKPGIPEEDIEKYFSVPFSRKFALHVGGLRKLFAQGAIGEIIVRLHYLHQKKPF